jgi:hypothetical protein
MVTQEFILFQILDAIKEQIPLVGSTFFIFWSKHFYLETILLKLCSMYNRIMLVFTQVNITYIRGEEERPFKCK